MDELTYDAGELRLINQGVWHKGFYNYDDPYEALSAIDYTDFFEESDDDDFPYDSALLLLRGSCNHFAWALRKLLEYHPYVIEESSKKGFHVFCQVYKNGTLFFVDARGITSSFSEFMFGIKLFVNDECVIRPVTVSDIEEWEADCEYNKEAYAFSEAVIRKYMDYYTI